MSGQYHHGLLALKRCAKKFVFKSKYRTNTLTDNEINTVAQANETNSRAQTPRSSNSPGEYVGFLSAIARADHNPERTTREIEEPNFDQKLEKDIISFSNSIQLYRSEIIHKTKFSSDFWLSRGECNQMKYPILCNLASILSCILSSSASIERHFSTCGNVIKKNAGNIGVDLFISRCMIKANLDIIKYIDAFDY